MLFLARMVGHFEVADEITPIRIDNVDWAIWAVGMVLNRPTCKVFSHGRCWLCYWFNVSLGNVKPGTEGWHNDRLCPPNHVLEPWMLEYNLCFTGERVYLHQVAAIRKVGSSFSEAKEDKSIQGVWDMIIPFGLLLLFSAHL